MKDVDWQALKDKMLYLYDIFPIILGLAIGVLMTICGSWEAFENLGSENMAVIASISNITMIIADSEERIIGQ